MPRMRIAPLLALVLLTMLAAPASSAVKKPAARPAARAQARHEWKPVVPFIEDDFGRALALAKERKRPVFIEGWASW